MKPLVTRTIIILSLLVGVGLFNIAVGEQATGQSASETEGFGELRRAVPQAVAKAIVRQLYEGVFNTGNLDSAGKLISTSYIDHNPLMTGLATGLEGFKQAFTLLRTAFPDLHFTIEETIVKGDKVVCRVTMRGTHKGVLMGIVPTNKPVTVTEIEIFRIADGAIVERWGTLDGVGLMQQLGVIHVASKSSLPSAELKGEPTFEGKEKVAQESHPNHQTPSNLLNTLGISPSNEHARSPLTTLTDWNQLKNVFQSDSGQVRLIALLSPN